LIVKKLLCTALLVAGLLSAASASAQVFGQYTPADIMPVNSRLTGAYVDLSSNVAGLLGQLRLSFYPNVDFGFQGGFGRLDTGESNKTTLRLGGDVRFGVAQPTPSFPMKVAVGGAIGIETSDKYHVLRFGPTGVASHAFTMSPSASISPYVGAMLSFASVDIGGTNQTDFSVPLRLGAELRAIPGIQVTAELQLRLGDDFADHTAFSGGVNLPF
jgi:hypothetical protein